MLKHKHVLWGIVAVVLIGHAVLTRSVMSHLLHTTGSDKPSIDRMEAELVADMKLTAPPVVAALPVPAELPSLPTEAAAPAASAASKPDKPPKPAKKPKPPATPPSAPEPVLAAASAPEPEASAPTQLAAASQTEGNTPAPPKPPEAASSPRFEWPKATRVTFKMEGYLRGPIYGSAKVEWVRQDNKYQVHVDAYAGPSFAPLASQRWTSEGVITPKGLVPTRFESVNKLLIKSATPKVVSFEDNEVLMPDGTRIERPNDVQDPASHYIQMAYQFMLDARGLDVGKTVEMPVVDTRKLRQLVYDIESIETLSTPLGQIETFKLRPRVPAKNSKGEDVLAELWIAPALQYLPIRMLLRIGDQNYFDMQMDKPPQQSPADADEAVGGIEGVSRTAPKRVEMPD